MRTFKIGDATYAARHVVRVSGIQRRFEDMTDDDQPVYIHTFHVTLTTGDTETVSGVDVNSLLGKRGEIIRAMEE